MNSNFNIIEIDLNDCQVDFKNNVTISFDKPTTQLEKILSARVKALQQKLDSLRQKVFVGVFPQESGDDRIVVYENEDDLTHDEEARRVNTYHRTSRSVRGFSTSILSHPEVCQ